jgi:hypothetical protein
MYSLDGGETSGVNVRNCLYVGERKKDGGVVGRVQIDDHDHSCYC